MVSTGELPTPVVRVVDDDVSICRMVTSLLTGHAIEVVTYPSATEFLRTFDAALPGCVVTDVRMPGMSGIELQVRLSELGSMIPTVVISGDLDVSTALRAMKNRAIDVLEKPFLPRVLLDRVRQAIDVDKANRIAAARSEAVRQKLSQLTAREQEVFDLVAAGLANKCVARTLDITEKTVEAHRGRMMKKLGARNLVELVRLAMTADAAQSSQAASGTPGRPG